MAFWEIGMKLFLQILQKLYFFIFVVVDNVTFDYPDNKKKMSRMQKCVPETIQEVIELTGFLCFLFRSTPRMRML